MVCLLVLAMCLHYCACELPLIRLDGLLPQALHKIVDLLQRDIHQRIVFAMRRQTDPLVLSLSLVHSKHNRLHRRSIHIPRILLRSNDKVLLPLRLIRHRQTKHVIHISGIHGPLERTRLALPQMYRFCPLVILLMHELQAELLAQGHAEADIVALELDGEEGGQRAV